MYDMRKEKIIMNFRVSRKLTVKYLEFYDVFYTSVRVMNRQSFEGVSRV